ncbi:hypothetical protein PAXRUDRAFT_791481 [Paxillus rubicundulus Ve08.2h10]|uniref:Uncharacterized protein n=1 Tax=Paxillus rubicundulus Ve08.2h10 TaxID=930991 RepID=A0A0D0CFQ6_9AGAM|nr:hypothetical protein PAXRUDRAFT_791481 [Paxillus rubicundulus Ve08.2h10]
MPFKLVSQFMEDVFAKEDCICDRPSCKAKIKAGEPCFYVATIDPGQPGRHVCAPCYFQYRKKAATSSHLCPDPQTIQQSVNAAQRKSMVNPPPVIAVPQQHHSGGPDQPLWTRIPGPDIVIPSTSWQGSASAASGSLTTSMGLGYTVQHAHYAAECQCWVKMSYAFAPAETISLAISAVHEGAAHKKTKWVQIGNICEGKKAVDAQIDAASLIKLALETILPKLHAFSSGFQWHAEEFVVCDSEWVNLSTHSPLVPYFYQECMQATCKDPKARNFKSKQFPLMVVIPESQWNDYEIWCKEAEVVISFSTFVAVLADVICFTMWRLSMHHQRSVFARLVLAWRLPLSL